jgi:glucose uptake protein GlcU
LFMIIFSFVIIVVEMSSNCLKILPFSIFMGAHYHFGYCIDLEGLRL